MCIVVVISIFAFLCIHMIIVVIITCVFVYVWLLYNAFLCILVLLHMYIFSVYIYICKAPRAIYRLGAISSLSYYCDYYYHSKSRDAIKFQCTISSFYQQNPVPLIFCCYNFHIVKLLIQNTSISIKFNNILFNALLNVQSISKYARKNKTSRGFS